MNQISITVPDDLQHWVDQRIALGRYVDAGDYLRDLMRRDQAHDDDESAWLREQITEGLASGIVDMEPEDVIEQIIAERHARSA